jgi:hypothetical protein
MPCVKFYSLGFPIAPFLACLPSLQYVRDYTDINNISVRIYLIQAHVLFQSSRKGRQK